MKRREFINTVAATGVAGLNIGRLAAITQTQGEKDMAKKFEGVFVALTTPFDGDEVSTGKFRENIGKLNEDDLSGYVVLGSTGECVSISDEESGRLVKTVRDAAAPGRKVIVGTARESARLTVDFTNRMAEYGIDAALVRAPSYFKAKMTREALKQHYLAVADKAKVPVILYNIPQNTGIMFESGMVAELARHQNIIGLKESAGNIFFLSEVIRQVPPDFVYLLGHGSAFLPALLMGASGAILAVANAAPGICSRIYRLFRKGKIKEAADLQLDLVPLSKALETYGIAGLKYALDLEGRNGGPTRLPLLPPEEKAKTEIAGILKSLNLIS